MTLILGEKLKGKTLSQIGLGSSPCQGVDQCVDDGRLVGDQTGEDGGGGTVSDPGVLMYAEAGERATPM